MSDKFLPLTERERQCLRLVHAHFNSKQIARELGIKPGTVDRHCENAAKKLQVESRVAAALALAAREDIPNESQCELAAMEQMPVSMLDRGAERTSHGFHRRYHSTLELARSGSNLPPVGHDRSEAANGAALDRRHAEAGVIHDRGGRDDGVDLHRGRDAGRKLPSFGEGSARLGSILIVFGVAAAAAWILTAVAGAEHFAFVLQRLRYGG